MKPKPWPTIWSGAIAIAVALLAANAQWARADGSSAPATQPDAADISGGVTVAGRVNIASSWELQRPDLARVVVYLGSDPVLDARPVPSEPAQMAQKDKAFVPSFLVIARGMSVDFPNWDHFEHNVFSRSAAAPAFDLNRYSYGESKSRVFDKLGVVQMFCNIHPDMRALVVITPNICFTRADGGGRFQLGHVPPGKFDLVVWQERCGEQHRSIDTRGGDVSNLSFTLDQNRRSILANDPPTPPADYGVTRGLSVKREVLNLPTVPDAHPASQPPPGK